MKQADRYSIGIGDEQHRKRVNLITRLQSALDAPGTDNEVFAVMNSRSDYTHDHCEHEETLVEEIRFPAIDAQKRMHESLVHQTHDILVTMKRFGRKASGRLAKI